MALVLLMGSSVTFTFGPVGGKGVGDREGPGWKRPGEGQEDAEPPASVPSRRSPRAPLCPPAGCVSTHVAAVEGSGKHVTPTRLGEALGV